MGIQEKPEKVGIFRFSQKNPESERRAGSCFIQKPWKIVKDKGGREREENTTGVGVWWNLREGQEGNISRVAAAAGLVAAANKAAQNQEKSLKG